MQDNCEIFTAWVLILQIASKMPTRGVLADEDGPLTAEDFSYMTGFDEKIFSKALIALSNPKIGWLGEYPNALGEHPDTLGLNRTEQNGTEQKTAVKGKSQGDLQDPVDPDQEGVISGHMTSHMIGRMENETENETITEIKTPDEVAREVIAELDKTDNDGFNWQTGKQKNNDV
jgi:hypothetical protein